MSTVEIRSRAFTTAALRSERNRILGLLWGVVALAVVIGVRTAFFGVLGGFRFLFLTYALLSVAALYEGLMLWFVSRRLKAERALPAPVWYANVVVETAFPTLAVILTVESGIAGPYQALLAPASLTYFYFIILSTLRLSPVLSCVTGVLAATGFLTATGYVYWQFAGLRLGTDFALPSFLTYAAFLLVGGLVAGGVAGQIRRHVAAALREAETRREKERLEHDLNVARSIQQALLPKEAPSAAEFRIAGWNRPAEETGGDYYDWQRLADGRVVIVLADVTGHGIGPALVTTACRAYGRATLPSGSGDALGAAMEQLNELLVADLPPGKLVTLVTAVVDPDVARVELLSAGHGPLLVFRAADRSVQGFAAHGVPFGVAPGMRYGPPQDLAFAEGDLLVLITDGFFEWENGAGEAFGVGRLEDVIRGSADRPPDEIITRMHEAVTAFVDGATQTDDLTAVVVKRGA